MATKEFHIDGRFQLFGNFYHACVYDQHSNPFWASHLPFMEAATDAPTIARLADFRQFETLGILAADSAGNKYIPLNANVVIPDGVGEAPFPLAVLIHGQAASYFGDNDQVIPEVRSYRGYRYLQEYLAEKGVASVSVNVNVTNQLGGEGDFQPAERIEITMLILSMLNQLVNAPITTGDQPIRFKRSNGTLVPLQEGLVEDPEASASSAEGLLQGLKNDLRGKLSFTKLGFMGHSRAGEAVALLQPFFTARVGTVPTDFDTPGPTTNPYRSIPAGPYNQGTVGNHSYQMHHHLYHFILNIMGGLGNPTMSVVKTLVALQPQGRGCLTSNATTFYLVVASSHDEDVQEVAANNYEDPDCPKALVFSHGASHARFNTVWRQLRGPRRNINRQIMCQSPIRMLSNAGHEGLCKATVGNAFLAGLLDENHRYGFFTGEIRAASLGQDIDRVWKFPFPFGSPPAIKPLTLTALTATNTSTNAAVTGQEQDSLDILRKVNNNQVYIHDPKVMIFTRPATQGLSIRIPIATGDSLVSRTHFSFRYTKEYDPRSAAARRRVDFRNYVLRLKRGTSTVGVDVAGRDVPSPHNVAYPTMDLENGVCTEATKILLQTAEVPLSLFLSNGQPTTDLAQVDAIELSITGTAGASGDEVWILSDILLTTRNLPAAPSGFAIP